MFNVLDPVMMHQLRENDAQKLASLPLHFGEYKKDEAQQYLATLAANLENYDLQQLASSINASSSNR